MRERILQRVQEIYDENRWVGNCRNKYATGLKKATFLRNRAADILNRDRKRNLTAEDKLSIKKMNALMGLFTYELRGSYHDI